MPAIDAMADIVESTPKGGLPFQPSCIQFGKTLAFEAKKGRAEIPSSRAVRPHAIVAIVISGAARAMRQCHWRDTAIMPRWPFDRLEGWRGQRRSIRSIIEWRAARDGRGGDDQVVMTRW